MLKMQFSSKSTIIRQFVDGFKPWLEEQLGVPMAETIQLRFDHGISMIAAATLLPKARFRASEEGLERTFENRVLRIEFPPDSAPAIAMTIVPDESSSFGSREQLWRADWLDCPAAIYLCGLSSPIVVLNVPFVAGGQCHGDWREIVLVRRNHVEDILNLMKAAGSARKEPSLHYHHGGLKRVHPTRWDDLVLDPSIVRLLQNDFESFFEREAWFSANRLAFRRGYLLYGPPGNGKTSAIRAMLSRPGITGHTINLFRQELDDDDLTCLFESAASTAPAIIVLEDIDRCFEPKPRNGSDAKVSLQHLLNCLDGATTREGVIVVATANNPSVLDPAILRRPGRFDRVIGFANPTRELRQKYFRKMCPSVESVSIDECADASEGFSFAQLQEAYIFAGQFAFDEERLVDPQDVLRAINTLRKALQCADWKGEGTSGFKVDKR